jgi:hypothetical protein
MARMTSYPTVESHLRKPVLSISDWEEIIMLTEDPSFPSAHILADGILTPPKWETIARLISDSASRSNISLGREAPAKTWTSKATSIFNKIGPAGKLAARHIDAVPAQVRRLLVGRGIGPYAELSKVPKAIRERGHGLVPGMTKTKAAWTSEEIYEEEILERYRDYMPGCDCKMCLKFRSTAESDIRMKRFSEAISDFNQKFFSETHDPRAMVPSHEHWVSTLDAGWDEMYEPFPGRPGIRAGFTLEQGVELLSSMVPVTPVEAAPATVAPVEPRPTRRRRRARGDEITIDELARTLPDPDLDIPF